MRALGVIVAVVLLAGIAAADEPLPDAHTDLTPPAPVDAPPDLPQVDQGSRQLLHGAHPRPPDDDRPLLKPAIDHVFRSTASRLRSCFAAAILGGPAEFRRPRTLVLGVGIKPDGSVDRVSVITAVTTELDACVVSRVKRLRFPTSRDGARVRYPFVFGAIWTSASTP